MTAGRASFRATLHTVRSGTTSFRVLQVPLVGQLVDQGVCWSSYLAALDKASIRTFALAWAVAARSPRTVTYFPIRRPTWGENPGSTILGDMADHDLVVVHHSAQLRPSAWRSIRQRLGPGRPTTVRVPSRAVEPVPRPSDWTKDQVRAEVAARTVILTGSRAAFTADLDSLRYLVHEAPAEHVRHPKHQQCADLAGRAVHLEYASRPA